MTATETPAWWTDAPPAGLHRGLSYDEYSRLSGINHSVLRRFARSAAHAREAMVNPSDQSDAQREGHTCHVAILEPERFELQYVAAPRFDKRTKDGKAGWAQFQAANADKEVVTQDEYDLARRLRDSVWAHPTAAELLRGAGLNEVVATWRDEDTGILCKARLDRLTSLAGWSTIVDLKTSADASRSSFSRSIYTYAYHQQAAFYLDGANALAPRPRKYLFIVVEKEPPYAVAVYELEDDAIELGRDEYRKHLAMYDDCMRTGRWPGYADGIDYVSLPSWAFKFHGE